MDLTIVIVNWNSVGYLRKCLSSIFSQQSNLKFEVVVVDNASFDGSSAMVQEEYPSINFIQGKENAGFARANNLGAGYARGATLLFLNPDTEIRDRAIDSLYVQLQQLRDPGVVGCRLLNSDGSLQTSCVQSLPTLLNQILDADVLRRMFPKSSLWGTAAFYEDGAATEVEAVSGACMMMRREVFERLGGFSSEYFMYGEDLDLCFKARLAGFRNYHTCKAVVVHHGGGSSQKYRSDFSTATMRESVYRLLRKIHGKYYSDCYRATLSIVAVLRITLLIILFPAWSIRGKKDGWNNSFRKWAAILRWGLGFMKKPPLSRHGDPPFTKPQCDEMKSCAGSAEN